jgi:hypothetical protein
MKMTTLMMEAVSTSETLVNFYKTTWCNIPEDGHLQQILAVELRCHSSTPVTLYKLMVSAHLASLFLLHIFTWGLELLVL